MATTNKIVCPHCHTANRVSMARLGEHPVCDVCKKALFTGGTLELTKENFNRHINNSDIPVLVDFWAPWCGPCKMMSPILDRAAKELEHSVRVAKVNTEIETELAGRFSIRSIPTLVVFHNGAVIGQRSGAIELAPLLHWLKSLAA